MNRKGKKYIHLVSRITVIALLLCMTALMAGQYGMLQAYAGDNIRETDVTSPANGNEIVLVDGSFAYLSKDKILKRINEIRLEACRTGVRDPRDESRNLTEEDYIPMRWSSDLEWIAQTRAAEATIHMAHQRPNGDSWGSMSHNGVDASAEVIAWNYSADILEGIDQWYEEKADWDNGTEGAVTGHYTSLILPGFQYIGIGAFSPTDGFGAVAGEITGGGSLDESQTGAKGAYKQKVEVKKSNLTISPDKSCTVHIGKTKTVSLNAKTSYENGLGSYWSPKVSPVILTGAAYQSKDTSIVTVDSGGKITGKKAGTADVSISYNGATYTTAVTVEDHNYKLESSVTPTCTEEGSKTKACSICGSKITEAIPPTGHKWKSSYTTDIAATCSREGSESIHCSVCDAVKEGSEQAIPVNDNHEWGSWVITEEGTCIREGSRYRECSACGARETGQMTLGGHKITSVSSPATCQEAGMRKHFECTVCHKKFKDASGSKELTSKQIKKLKIKKKKHSFKEKSGEYLKSEATCTKPAMYYYTCKMCHTKGSKTYKSGKALGHDFVSGSITKATAKRDGKISSRCSRCGKTNKGVKIKKASKIVVLNRKSVAYVGGGGEKDLIKVVVKNSKYPLSDKEYKVDYSEPVYRGKKSNGTVTVRFAPECRYYSGSMTLKYKITKAPKK